MKLRFLLVCGVYLTATALFATAATAADRRVALVIGNAAYKNASSLSNTINDSTAIASLFKSVGFEVVISRTDLGVVDFKRAVREFLITAENADIAVVYYAGHGVEIGGTNYLVPVDAKLGRDYDVEDEAVALDRIIWALQSVRRLRLILLDACRDNPFPAKIRSAGIRSTMQGGLAKIEDVSSDTLVAYAAKAGSVSYDGDGVNSPYATALLKHLTEPGLDIRIALGRVRDDVIRMTGGRQEPFIYGSLGGAIIPLVQPVTLKGIEPPSALPTLAKREPAIESQALKQNLAAVPAKPNLVASSPSPAATPAKVGPAKTPPANSLADTNTAVDRVDPALACSRDEQRLARLREAPVAEEIARLERSLSCNRLRAQVQRLYESTAPESRTPAAPADRDSTPPPRQQAQSQPVPEDTCSRDMQRLARLRTDPSIDAIAKFERELGCEQIRPQLRRLRESFGG